MAKYTATVTTAAATAKICDIYRRKSDAEGWIATAFTTGTFGGGTLALQYSPDGGATKYTGKDFTGNSMSSTAAAVYTTQPIGNGASLGEYISLYANLSGSTAGSVTVTVFDNR